MERSEFKSKQYQKGEDGQVLSLLSLFGSRCFIKITALFLLIISFANAFDIPVTLFLRGETPPSAVRGVSASTIAEKRALILHKADIDTSGLMPAGVVGTYSPQRGGADPIWHRLEITNESAQFVHLIPNGDEPVRATLAWEDEDSELDLRLVAASEMVRPFTIDSLGRLVRGDNNKLLAERVDLIPTSLDMELTLQITTRDRELFGLNSSENLSRKAVLLISGAELSPKMVTQQAFIVETSQSELEARERVEEYLRVHDIPRRETLEDGRVREIVDIVDGEPLYIYSFNLGAARTSHADKVWPGGSMGLQLTGRSLPALGIWDDGPVRATHQEFGNRVTIRDRGEPTAHGTHVGGTMVAAGVVANSRGMAYEARLTSYNWNNAVSQMANEARTNGMLVSQHSYGFPRSSSEHYNNYDFQSSARNWDNLHLQNPYKLGSKSAGNDGAHGFYTVSDAGNAKNNITIGSINDIPGGWSNRQGVQRSTFSSRGPVLNSGGRIKPDLVAKGHRVYSTGHNSDRGYTTMSGTSMAGPAAAAMLGLMQEHYFNTHDRTYMRAATLKAVAIHTAGDAGTEGPNATFGWGVINPAEAAKVITANDGGAAGLIRELQIDNGNVLTFEYTGNGRDEIIATIVWPDDPGARLVNDLDLRVTVDGREYLPWRLNPANLTGAAIRADNDVDNVERINTGVVRAGARVVVEISHKGRLNGRRNLSLVVSGVEGKPATSLTLKTPRGGDTLWATTDHKIEWDTEGEIENVRIEWGHAGGQWSVVESSIANTGSYIWTVPDTTHESSFIRVLAVEGSAVSRSEAFVIAKIPSTITIKTPQVGDTLWATTDHKIEWDTDGEIENVRIEWGHAGGQWSVVESSIANTGSYIWTVPDTTHESSFIRVLEVDGEAESGSEAFVIAKIPTSITLTSPSAGDTLWAESEHKIEWESEGDIESVRIEWGHRDGQWSVVESSIANTGSYIWTVPDTAHQSSFIRVIGVGVEAESRSDAFVITHKPKISFTPITVESSLRNREIEKFSFTLENIGKGELAVELSSRLASLDYFDLAGWSTACDDLGSTVDGDGSELNYSIAQQQDEDKWPWAILSAGLDVDFRELTAISVSYSSDHPVRLLIDQDGLSESGTSYGALLPATVEPKDTTLYIPTDFSQPQWVSDAGLDESLDLSKVSGITFSVVPLYETATVGRLKVSSVVTTGLDLAVEKGPMSIPVESMTIEPLSSKSFDIVIASEDFAIGEYFDTIVISHNDREAERFHIPVNIVIRENLLPTFKEMQIEYTFIGGDYIEIDIEVTDADGDIIRIDPLELPSWLTFSDDGSGGALITGVAPSIEGDSSYIFTVRASDSYAPDEYVDLELTIQITHTVDIVLLDRVVSNGALGIFPERNPVSISDGEFRFVLMTDKPALVKVRIFDMVGNLIDQQDSYTGGGSGYHMSWDLRNRSGRVVSPGSYLVVAEVSYGDGGTSFVERVIGITR